MSQANTAKRSIGNEFVLSVSKMQTSVLAVSSKPALSRQIIPAMATGSAQIIPVSIPSHSQTKFQRLDKLTDLFHEHSLLVFALMLLVVGTAAIKVGGNYYSAHVLSNTQAVESVALPTQTIAGLNLTVPNAQLQTKLQTITNQSANITVGSQTAPIAPATIRSWITVTPSANKAKDYLRLNPETLASSLQTIANQYVEAPVNQVTSTATGTPTVITAGVNGVKLSDPSGLTQQALTAAKNVMNGGGLSFNTPTESQAFASVTTANFDKLLEVDVTTKRMYAYQNGQLVNTFLVTAGAPATPTPIGEFHIWEKLPLQTMTGFNPNGTKYVQPNVQWINYFDHSGDAVHGNYWRPASVFGNVNTSHGCVGVQDPEAVWIYNWAPIGTTVITHT